MLTMFAIKDNKTGAFAPPFFAAHTEQVVRSIRRTLTEKRPGDSYAEFPEDFALWSLGTFNQENGELVEEINHIANLVAFKTYNQGENNDKSAV